MASAAAVASRAIRKIFCVLFFLEKVLNYTQGASRCDVSEFACHDGAACVPLNNYCDKIVHCRDYSDEPPDCTVCNRTYFGYVNRSYSLEVHPSSPQRAFTVGTSSLTLAQRFGEEESKISQDWRQVGRDPIFLCVLTFTAAGKDHGDIVQITFSEFHVGHFKATAAKAGDEMNGCPDDHVSIDEPKAMIRGGRWCGESIGLNVYYSETDTVRIILKATTSSYGEYFDNPLRFTLKYRFMKKTSAIVRYGTYYSRKYRGDVVRNAPCSREFQGCRARTCKIQSPNFPGLYPRNATCYYLIKALPAPSPDLIPVIALSQSNDRMMQIGQREHASRVSPESILRRGLECTNPEDYVSIYDGGGIKSPILSQFCGTSQLTNISSSGPEMLVVFHSAASGKMNNQPNLVNGFEFDVIVLFMKKKKSAVNSKSCEENIQSFGHTTGVIYNPLFAMSANSSCVYRLSGRRNEILWFYFTKYHRTIDKRLRSHASECQNRLVIYDGAGDEPQKLIGEYCNESAPPMCVRSREKGFVTRPCSTKESFLSNSSSAVIIQEFNESTSLLPLEYVIHYEFVSVFKPIKSNRDDQCGLKFDSSKGRTGSFTAPKSLFYYGRGGEPDLFCKYTFSMKENESVRVKIMNIHFPDRMCKTIYNLETDTYDCIARITSSAILEIFEIHWNSTKLSLGCVCDYRIGNIIFTSHSNLLEIHYTIRDMTWSQDYNDFFFEIQYEFITVDICTDKRIYNGTYGEIVLGDKTVFSHCDALPRKVVAGFNFHTYLSIPGNHQPSKTCLVKSRFIVYDSEEGNPIKSVCPSDAPKEIVNVFSSGWSSRLELPRGEPENIVFKYLPRDKGVYTLKFLEVTREPRPSALESLQRGGYSGKPSALCDHECPEIAACISTELWCDGVPHCPLGSDEKKNLCIYFTITWVHLAMISASLLTIVVVIAVMLLAKVYKKNITKKKKKKEAQRLMTQEVLLPMAYHAENLDSLYLRGGI